MLNSADNAVDVAQWPDLFDLIGGEKADVDTDCFRDAGIKSVFVHTVFAAREADIRNLPETDGLAGFGFKLLIERDGIFMNLADRVAHVEEWQ